MISISLLKILIAGREQILSLGLDAIYNSDTFNVHHKLSKLSKVRLLLERKILRRPTAFEYKDAIKYIW